MNYNALFSSNEPVRVGLIGTGNFGNSLLFQMRRMARMQSVAVCDINIDAARRACLHAGWQEDALATCQTEAEVGDALAAGRLALVEDAQLFMPHDLDVVVEATGYPEAGASHAHAALLHGKHVVIVTKETDCVVGPILARLAWERDLVYTQADGDQPSMLIGLISWAETLGLEIICVGKVSDSDWIYNRSDSSITQGGRTVHLSDDELDEHGLWRQWSIDGRKASEVVERRHSTLQYILSPSVPDICEMAVVMNATGYGYDAPTLHSPVARLAELPELMASRVEGGILNKTGVIDAINCLRREDEVSPAGGVFVVFRCHDEPTWQLLRKKGHLVSADGTRGAIYLPYHLLGVETAISILAAHDLGIPTGAQSPQPTVDMAVIATESLPAGSRLSMTAAHEIPGTQSELMPAKGASPGNPVPYYMAAQNVLTCDVPAGAVLTTDMIANAADSVLWNLRAQQDKRFL